MLYIVEEILISSAELINLVRHMQAYPSDSLGDALKNIFDFDIYKPETIDKLSEILEAHGYVFSSFFAKYSRG